MTKFKQWFVLTVFLASATHVFGAKKQKIEHAPLPAKMLTAKTVYIQNESGQPAVADKAYTELKQWGRYQLVDTKEKADLVFLFTLAYSRTEHNTSDYISLYNSQTGAYTSGSVPGGSTTTTWTYTQLRVVDPNTSVTLWADERVWLRKHSATDELMDSLRQRVEEQEKAVSP